MKKIRIGIDPDTKATGICCQVDGEPPRFMVAHAKGRLEEHRRRGMAIAIAMQLQELAGDLEVEELLPRAAVEIAIEWQHLRPMREKNPNSMMAVQAVAGMALAAAVHEFDEVSAVYLPIPSDWRGTVPKEAKHALWMQEAQLVEGQGPLASVPASALSHCKCALGLVLWLRRGRTIS